MATQPVEHGRPERWLTVAEVAESQHVHVSTVRRWIADKRLPARRIGRHWRVSARQLDLVLGNGDTTKGR